MPRQNPIDKETSRLFYEIQEAQDRILASDVDVTLLERNLLLNPAERLRRHDASLNAILTMRELGRLAGAR